MVVIRLDHAVIDTTHDSYWFLVDLVPCAMTSTNKRNRAVPNEPPWDKIENEILIMFYVPPSLNTKMGRFIC